MSEQKSLMNILLEGSLKKLIFGMLGSETFLIILAATKAAEGVLSASLHRNYSPVLIL